MTENSLSDKTFVKGLIDDDIPCYYRRGLMYRGAKRQLISKEKALDLLPIYGPEMSFHVLSMEKDGDKDVLVFNEYDANDLY